MSKADQRVLSFLRQMIISGELQAGERVAEIPTAEQLGVSRTPVRIAFRALEQEGLLIRQPRRGYRVREVSNVEIADAVEVRGVLEGLAAQQAAEKGLNQAQRDELKACLSEGDAIFEKGFLVEDDFPVFHDINKRFHSTILEASQNSAISQALSHNEHLPFASVSAIAVDPHNLKQEFTRFHFAHMQHHSIFDAIDNQQSTRAGSIMREHANATLRYAEIFVGKIDTENQMRVINSPPEALHPKD